MLADQDSWFGGTAEGTTICTDHSTVHLHTVVAISVVTRTVRDRMTGRALSSVYKPMKVMKETVTSFLRVLCKISHRAEGREV